MSFSVDNLFQMKTSDGEKEKKFDLFSFSSRSSYNFEAERYKFSSLNTSVRSSVIKNMNMNMSFTHDFYKFDVDQESKINKLLIMENKPFWKRSFARLTNFRLSSSFNLQGSKRGGRDITQESAFDQGGDDVIETDAGDVVAKDEYYDQLYQAGGERFEPETSFSGLDIPWSTSLSFEFNYNKLNPLDPPRKTYYMNISRLEIKLTKNWKINYQARYDLRTKELINQSVTFYRDMHCWQARFEWRPSGIGAPYFYFRINVKSSQLRDLKWDKRGGRSSVMRYY